MTTTTYQSRACADADRARADAEAAHAMLAAHVPDRETGICPICLLPGPCVPANAAANRLIDLGQPVLAPVDPTTKRAGWWGWLVPYVRGFPRSAPLLTFGWRRQLGLLDSVGRV